MAAKYPGWSPYNYTLNSPLIFFDPDGKEPVGQTKAAQKKPDRMVSKLNEIQTEREIVTQAYAIKDRIEVSFGFHSVSTQENGQLPKGQYSATIRKYEEDFYVIEPKIGYNDDNSGYDEVKTGAHELIHLNRSFYNTEEYANNKKRDERLEHDQREEEIIANKEAEQVKKEYNHVPESKPCEPIKRK